MNQITETSSPAADPDAAAQVSAQPIPRNPDEPTTLVEAFECVARSQPRPDTLNYKRDGQWMAISSDELLRRARHIAGGLYSLGVRQGDRVALLSESRPEWTLTDAGCMFAAAVDVPIYPTLMPPQVRYILNDSGARVLVLANEEKYLQIREILSECPAVEQLVFFEKPTPETPGMSLADLEKLGRELEAQQPDLIHNVAHQVRPNELATIIYTSGTTGEPKGVMLTHDNIYSNVAASMKAIPFDGRDVGLSFLPLSHIFERMAGHYMMFATGTSIAYAESIDTVPANLQEVRPTLVLSVPRLYEKMYARVLENALTGGVLKKKIFFWARGVAERWANEKLAGREPGGLLARQYAIAQKLVFSKLKARTGGRLRYFVSGGAPLSPDINKFFYAAGLEILEGYGLTETSPVIAVNTPENFRIGTVGKAIDGVEIKIAADGEILTRGPHVMKGYYNKPDATREVIEPDGWFHTGDIGELRDGFLAITDRKKDIIVTAGGKNIAPQPLENKVKTNKYVAQAVMLGDKRKFPSMLIVPNFDQLERWAMKRNIIWTDRAQLLRMPTIQAKMEKEVNEELAGVAHFELPKKIGLLEHDFSIEKGELTPTQKVKRRAIDKHYKTLIDSLYDEAERSGITDSHAIA